MSFSSFDDFYNEHCSPWSKNDTMLDDVGLEFVVRGLMSNMIAPIDIFNFFERTRLVDMSVGGILDINTCLVGHCNAYCDKIQECRKLGLKSIAVRVTVNNSQAEDYLCQDCDYKGLIIPNDKLPALKEIIISCLSIVPKSKDIHWSVAKDLNMNRDKCILCGKATEDRALYFSVIKYCDCIDKLVEQEKKDKLK